jgi:hypothetical protein
MSSRQPVAALLILALVAACGAPATSPSTAVSVTPTAGLPSATASAAVLPTVPPPSPTPVPATPTTAPAASASSSPSMPSSSLAIKGLSEVFASKRTKVAWNTLTAAENALYDQHPEFESIAPRWNLIEQNLNDCGGVQPGIQRDACGSVVWQDYLLYKQSGLDEAFSTTVLAYQWALGQGIDKAWLDDFVTKLVEG